MLGIFIKKTKKEKLQLEYQKLLEQAYNLSKFDRKQSDQKTFEANQILNRLNDL
mgnify:FL=1|tara:strand:+ start:482 stop:643 length:162 start_codon:yes stop_codon:yes gene_type:complete